MKLLFALIAVAFCIWALIDVLRSNMDTSQRILWILIVIIFPVVGPLIYYIKQKN